VNFYTDIIFYELLKPANLFPILFFILGGGFMDRLYNNWTGYPPMGKNKWLWYLHQGVR
jgi:hypothetical protein